MSEEHLEQKIAKVLQKEDLPFVKKRGAGHTILNVFTVLGLTLGFGYYAVKKKLLGNPPSKIRKGLLYSTIAGLILYKCAPDRLQNIYEYTKNRIEYEDQRFQLKMKIKNKESELEKKTILLEQKQNELKYKNEYLNKVENEKEILELEKKYSDSLRLVLERNYEQGFLSGAKNAAVLLVKEKNYVVSDKKVVEKEESKQIYGKPIYEKPKKLNVEQKLKVKSQAESKIMSEKNKNVKSDKGHNLGLEPPDAKVRIIEGTDQKIIDFYGRNYYVVETSWVDVYGDSVYSTTMQFR